MPKLFLPDQAKKMGRGYHFVNNWFELHEQLETSAPGDNLIRLLLSINFATYSSYNFAKSKEYSLKNELTLVTKANISGAAKASPRK
jgi:hypothetical protein